MSTSTAAEFLPILRFLVCILEMHIKAGDGNVPHRHLHLPPFSLRGPSVAHKAPPTAHVEAISDLRGFCGADGPSSPPGGKCVRHR